MGGCRAEFETVKRKPNVRITKKALAAGRTPLLQNSHFINQGITKGKFNTCIFPQSHHVAYARWLLCVRVSNQWRFFVWLTGRMAAEFSRTGPEYRHSL